MKISTETLNQLRYSSDFWQSLSLNELLYVALGEKESRLLHGIKLEELYRLKKEELDFMLVPDETGDKMLAIIELAKRISNNKKESLEVANDPKKAAIALCGLIGWEPCEKVAILFLNIKNEIVSSKIVSIGSQKECTFGIREILREGLLRDAARLIVGHNHPSGNLGASKPDIAVTETLLAAGVVTGVAVIDHLIVWHNESSSLREVTDLWDKYPQGDE
jgi:DNA repair protein RadC